MMRTARPFEHVGSKSTCNHSTPALPKESTRGAKIEAERMCDNGALVSWWRCTPKWLPGAPSSVGGVWATFDLVCGCPAHWMMHVVGAACWQTHRRSPFPSTVAPTTTRAVFSSVQHRGLLSVDVRQPPRPPRPPLAIARRSSIASAHTSRTLESHQSISKSCEFQLVVKFLGWRRGAAPFRPCGALSGREPELCGNRLECAFLNSRR